MKLSPKEQKASIAEFVMPDPNPGLDIVRDALALDPFDVYTAWMRMAPSPRPLERPDDLPGQVRLAGVLLLLYPYQGELTFALTRRTDNVATHKGQISLPGGALEPGEETHQTALRETCEEIGVCLDQNVLIGSLTPLYLMVSDFQIHPSVGFVPKRPDFQPDPVEVDSLLEMSVPTLLNDGIKTKERWTIRGMELDVPFYRMGEAVIWGATALILSEFEMRLRAILGSL
jgi:8-oxo-dGTP pyrophosphatase MutT (NUDIX family)